jgi:hypothetical protein
MFRHTAPKVPVGPIASLSSGKATRQERVTTNLPNGWFSTLVRFHRTVAVAKAVFRVTTWRSHRRTVRSRSVQRRSSTHNHNQNYHKPRPTYPLKSRFCTSRTWASSRSNGSAHAFCLAPARPPPIGWLSGLHFDRLAYAPIKQLNPPPARPSGW